MTPMASSYNCMSTKNAKKTHVIIEDSMHDISSLVGDRDIGV